MTSPEHVDTPLAPPPEEGAGANRLGARLDQVMCTLEGMTTLLAATPGDFAVVIHGDRDCLGVLVQGMDHPGTERFFGTQLGEPEAVAGQGRERLRECLEAVCEAPAPPVVFLLGTCMSALLGEDVESLAREMSQDRGVRVVALGGAGMGFVAQSTLLDRHACLLAEAASESGRERGASEEPEGLCLVGFDPGPEVTALAARMGLGTLRVLGPGAGLEDWGHLVRARAHVLLDEALHPRLATRLRSQYGQETIEVPFPVGSRATRGFFDALLGAFGENAVDPTILCGPEEEARALVERARRELGGLRLGYNLGSKKNLDARTLARAGLGDLAAFEELGCEVVLLVQGDDSSERTASLRSVLSGLGCRAPLRIFADTVFFGALCRAERCDLVYASDHLREEVAAAGAAFVPMGALAPGWDGVRGNLGRIRAALGRGA